METEKAELETLVSVLKKLEDRGFVAQFQATQKGLSSLASGKIYQPGEVKIESFYRFEGESDPEDNAVVYAISTSEGEKGTLIDGFSNSSDQNVGEFLRLVHEIHKD